MSFHRINIILLVCILFLSAINTACAEEDLDDSSNSDSDYTITTPYEYPVVPGTEEWVEMTPEERRRSSYVSQDVALEMDSYSLLITIIRYPYIVDIFAYDDSNEGIDAVRAYFPPLDVFLSRSDALEICNDYLGSIDENTPELIHDGNKVRLLLKYLSFREASNPDSLQNPIGNTNLVVVYTPNGGGVNTYYNSTYSDF